MLETLTSFLLKGAEPCFTDATGTSDNKEQCWLFSLMQEYPPIQRTIYFFKAYPLSPGCLQTSCEVGQVLLHLAYEKTKIQRVR